MKTLKLKEAIKKQIHKIIFENKAKRLNEREVVGRHGGRHKYDCQCHVTNSAGQTMIVNLVCSSKYCQACCDEQFKTYKTMGPTSMDMMDAELGDGMMGEAHCSEGMYMTKEGHCVERYDEMMDMDELDEVMPAKVVTPKPPRKKRVHNM